jgi:hypothetical protein
MRVYGPSALICARLRRLDFRRLLPFCCPDAARSSRRHSRAIGHVSTASPEHLAGGSGRGRRPLRVVAAASGESALAQGGVKSEALNSLLPSVLREDLVRIRALLPLCGIAFVVLIVIGLAVGGSSPAPDAPADEVVSFYRDNENRARTGIWFFAFAMPFLPLFASSLAGLQRPEGQDSRVVWRRLLLAGAAIMSATLGVAITTQLALADSTGPAIAPEVMQALNVIAGYVIYALLPATGTMMLGAAGWLLGRERVQGWLGWAALVLGIGLFVPFIGVLALILSLVWIIVASITVFRARAAGPMLAPAA